MKLFLSSLFLCVVFGAGKSARSQANRITVTRRTPHHSKGYGSWSKNKYGKPRKRKKHKISCDSFSCGPTANQIPNAKKVKCSKHGCTFSHCCNCPPIYNETCPASVYDNPLTRGLCYDQSDDEFCEIRPVAHIKSYSIYNNCGGDIIINGQTTDYKKYNCNSATGCGMVIGSGETKVFSRTQNIDFFPIGDSGPSGGGSQRLQFALDIDCASPLNLVWLELNQSPARCPNPLSPLPNSPNEAGSVHGDTGIEPCSDPDDYLEFGQEYICYNRNTPPQRVDCKAQVIGGVVKLHLPGTPHFSFARQAGFNDLNLGVSFENEQGDPYCSGGLLGQPSPVSRAQTQMSVEWCSNNPELDRQQSAKIDEVCDSSNRLLVCQPYCPKENFARKLNGWNPTIDTNCAACTLSNRKIAPGHYDPIELNYFAKYLSESSCVWDVKTSKWYQQPPTVTTQADYNSGHTSRKWNPNVGVAGYGSSSGASMFECWDPAGTGPQGIGWGESCDVDQFTRMKVTLCPAVVECFDTTETK